MKTHLISFIALSVVSGLTHAQDKPTQKDEHDIEKLIITATPLNRSVLESATPVSIISGEELKSKMAPTLGETLKNVPGVHSTYFGPVSSSPIIRGLDGPRIKIVQNGLDVSDASRVGPDHIVSTEASNAKQIEVLRGPATLLYGSGAIGGVVNVVDNRLPMERREEIEGDIGYLYDSVSDENTFSVNADGGTGNWAWHFDAFDRNTDNYEIPVAAEIGADEDENTGELANSSINADGFTVGTGYITDNFRAAFSFGQLDNQYGIPGHGHSEHEDHDEEDHDEEAHEEEIFGQLSQDRYQAVVDWKNLTGLITEVHWHNAYTDYTHQEIEDGMIGTTFENDSFESRLWAKHKELNGWNGVFGANLVRSDFSALGSEAFTPPSETVTKAFFLLEEKRQESMLWQLGLRYENVKITPDNAFFEEDEHHEDEDHDEEHHEIEFSEQSFNALSLSAGAVWTMDSSSSLAFNYAYSERAPSSAEIFANGPHIGTNSYEVGIGFEIHEEGDGYEIEQGEDAFDKEISNNIDLTYRYRNDSINVEVSAFYNHINDYIYQQSTGLFADGGHHHEEEEEHEEEGSLPVFIFARQDAKLYGLEAQLDWHINNNLRLNTYGDYTRAKLDDGTNVPRIPPMRIGAELHYEADNWHAEFGMTHYAKQDKVGPLETSTDSYTLVNASFNYYMDIQNNEAVLFVKGNNLTDEEARVHSSFLKEVAPLPGRSIVVGARYNF